MSEAVVAVPVTEASAEIAETQAEAETEARVAEAEATVAVAEARADAACEIAETQAEAAVAVAEAQNKGVGEWQNEIEHLQAQARETSERLVRMEAALAAQAERLITLTPPPQETPQESPASQPPSPSEGGAVPEGPAEPAPAERRRAHRWI